MARKKRRTSRRSSRRVFPEFVGRAQMTRDGFIYVIIDGEEEDVFVRAAKTRHALNGDTVRVAVTKPGGEKARREGEIVEIVERSRKPFVGVLHLVGTQAWVLMQSRSMPYDIEVDQEAVLAMGAESGMKVSAVVDRWERNDMTPLGHVVDVLGFPGENDTEMHAILAEFDLPYRFEKEVEDAADRIPDRIGPAEMEGRRDFRDVFTFTIDPADAKDFDDALSFRPLDNGNFEVGVRIADVTWYVRPGTPVDREAEARGTSVYLVDRTVPMLPEKLCNRLCSLRQGEDKLTFSTVFEMTPDAKVVSTWIGRTAICSDARLDYDQAQAVIDSHCEEGQSPDVASPTNLADPHVADAPRDDALRQAIITLHGMAQKLKAARFKAGAIDFDRPEMKVEVDGNGRPVNVYQKYSREANWLIEEFMLLANRSVAAFISRKRKPFVYRVHGDPNPVKLEQLRTFSKSFGYKMGETGDGKTAAKTISSLLRKAKGKPEFQAFEDIALRAMAKATYTTENIGHYGLAFKHYTHFTSPIRRYPDMMVHRLLAEYLGYVPRHCEEGGLMVSSSEPPRSRDFLEQKVGKGLERRRGLGVSPSQKEADVASLEARCKHASEREIIAADAERTSVKYKLVEFMQDKVDREFDGHITGVTEWGIYVAIEPTQIEGMIPLRTMRSDFYEFDESGYSIKGRRTHRMFRLGDPVRIRVKDANLEQRLLDYELIEPEEEIPAPEDEAVPRHGQRRAVKRGRDAKPRKSKPKSNGRK